MASKKELTVAMLLAGFSVAEIMEEMLKVYPGSGTTENSIYYYASKTPGVSLSKRNDGVDNTALAALQARLRPTVIVLEAPEAAKPGAEEETLEQMTARIRAEVDAEYAEKAAKEAEALKPQVRVVKGGRRK